MHNKNEIFADSEVIKTTGWGGVLSACSPHLFHVCSTFLRVLISAKETLSILVRLNDGLCFIIFKYCKPRNSNTPLNLMKLAYIQKLCWTVKFYVYACAVLTVHVATMSLMRWFKSCSSSNSAPHSCPRTSSDAANKWWSKQWKRNWSGNEGVSVSPLLRWATCYCTYVGKYAWEEICSIEILSRAWFCPVQGYG